MSKRKQIMRQPSAATTYLLLLFTLSPLVSADLPLIQEHSLYEESRREPQPYPAREEGLQKPVPLSQRAPPSTIAPSGRELRGEPQRYPGPDERTFKPMPLRKQPPPVMGRQHEAESATIESGTNRPGHDFRNFVLPEPNPELCLNACLDDQRCRAFTYVRPGRHAEQARCWLKNEASASIPDACCDSGMVFRKERLEPELLGSVDHGWCCARGETFEAPRHECLNMGGRMHESPESAQRACDSANLRGQPDSPRRMAGEPAQGICCRGSELFEAVEPECLEIGGSFHRELVIAEQACQLPPRHAVAEPRPEETRPEVAMKPEVQPAMAFVGEVQPIPDFLLVDHVLTLDPLNRWIKTGGPIGGLGYDVRYRAKDARSRNIMYVTDNYSGVNISTDGGRNWFAANQGINARIGPSGDAIPVFSLTVDPNNPNIVWAGLKDISAAYKSYNGGKDWVEVPHKPKRFPKIDAKNSFVFRGFTIQPGNSNVVYTAGEVPQNDMGEAFDRVRGRVYRTTDGGNSWHILWEGDNLARYVIIHPDNHDVLYVSTGIFDREAANSECKGCSGESIAQVHTIGCRGGVGVLKSTDGGTTWRELGIENGLTDLYIGSLVMHPSNPDVLLAGAGNNSCSDHWLGGKFKSTGGVFLSVDGGESWSKTLSNQTITSVEFAPASPNIAYAAGRARFHRSTDGGRTWTPVGRKNYPWGPPGAFSGFPIDILVDPDDPNTVFANNYGGGNVKSMDGGANWTFASQGYTGALMFDVEMHPADTSIIYAAARSGLFRSDDGGRSWQGLSNPPAQFPESYSVAVQPNHPNVVLASQELGGRLYRSTDGGNAWQEVFKLPIAGGAAGMYGFKRIVFAPSAQHVVYAASCRSNNHLNKNPSAFGVYVSKNSGKKGSWVKANGAQLGNKAVNDLAVHPKNHNIVWAATASDGLWRTTNGGTSWQKMNGLSPTDVRAVVLDPKNPNVVYAGARRGGVHKGAPNTKGAWSWHRMAAGMDDNDSIYTLAVDPARPLRVWAGSLNTGVRYWDSIEQQWIVFNQGLEMRSVFDLDISGDGKTLYAATHGGGVHRLRLSK